ncbi:MAG: anaerobic ribonucleoside-triphosphate reductase activating protein [Patescibacteria group bacterium]|nr:anaerobic ribonucleoside-triphosphate reductase activating protein [Patescibacteria group bacterium]MDD5172533.1 anaerobic ribonucleoside-triphosphate reductase activating protein [Patescibacteria group bacterium]
MIFRGWQKISLNEWPGKVCSVIFVGGCNFRCPFCYNRDLVLNPEKLPLIKEKEILNYCQKNKDLLDGIMITGGEPLKDQSPETKNKKGAGDLVDFIKKIKKIGLMIGVETNGTNPKMIAYLIKNKLIHYLAVDIKAPLKIKKYNQLTGVLIDLDNIKESIKIIINSKIDYEFRTTVVPGLLNEKDILEIIKSIRGAKKYYLQKFQPQKTIRKIQIKNDYRQDWFEKILKNLRKNTKIDVKLRI